MPSLLQGMLDDTGAVSYRGRGILDSDPLVDPGARLDARGSYREPNRSSLMDSGVLGKPDSCRLYGRGQAKDVYSMQHNKQDALRSCREPQQPHGLWHAR